MVQNLYLGSDWSLLLTASAVTGAGWMGSLSETHYPRVSSDPPVPPVVNGFGGVLSTAHLGSWGQACC